RDSSVTGVQTCALPISSCWSIWTGSTNMTDDAFTLMENNILEIDSSELANYYAEDFEQLWEKENLENTGNIHTVPVQLTFSDQRSEERRVGKNGMVGEE